MKFPVFSLLTRRSGDDCRHAIRSLAGHGGSHKANHMSQLRVPAPTGIAALALELATPVSEALQRYLRDHCDEDRQ